MKNDTYDLGYKAGYEAATLIAQKQKIINVLNLSLLLVRHLQEESSTRYGEALMQIENHLADCLNRVINITNKGGKDGK